MCQSLVDKSLAEVLGVSTILMMSSFTWQIFCPQTYYNESVLQPSCRFTQLRFLIADFFQALPVELLLDTVQGIVPLRRVHTRGLSCCKHAAHQRLFSLMEPELPLQIVLFTERALSATELFISRHLLYIVTIIGS